MTPNVEGNRRAALPIAEDQGMNRRVRLTAWLGDTCAMEKGQMHAEPMLSRYSCRTGLTLRSTFVAKTASAIRTTLAEIPTIAPADSLPVSNIASPTMNTGNPRLCSQKWMRANQVFAAAGYRW